MRRLSPSALLSLLSLGGPSFLSAASATRLGAGLSAGGNGAAAFLGPSFPKASQLAPAASLQASEIYSATSSAAKSAWPPSTSAAVQETVLFSWEAVGDGSAEQQQPPQTPSAVYGHGAQTSHFYGEAAGQWGAAAGSRRVEDGSSQQPDAVDYGAGGSGFPSSVWTDWRTQQPQNPFHQHQQPYNQQQPYHQQQHHPYPTSRWNASQRPLRVHSSAWTSPLPPNSEALSDEQKKTFFNRGTHSVAAAEEHWTTAAAPQDSTRSVSEPYDGELRARSQWSVWTQGGPGPFGGANRGSYFQRWRAAPSNVFSRYFPPSAWARSPQNAFSSEEASIPAERRLPGPSFSETFWMDNEVPLASDPGLLLQSNEALAPGLFARFERALPMDISPDLIGNLVEGSRRKLLLDLEADEGPAPVIGPSGDGNEQAATAAEGEGGFGVRGSHDTVVWYPVQESVEAAKTKFAGDSEKLELIERNGEVLRKEAFHRRRRYNLLEEALARHGLSRDPSSWLCREFVYCRHLSLRAVVFALWRHAALDQFYRKRLARTEDGDEAAADSAFVLRGLAAVEEDWRQHVLRTSSIDLKAFPVSAFSAAFGRGPRRLCTERRRNSGVSFSQEMELALLDRKNDFFKRRFEAVAERVPPARFLLIPYKSAPLRVTGTPDGRLRYRRMRNLDELEEEEAASDGLPPSASLDEARQGEEEESAAETVVDGEVPPPDSTNLAFNQPLAELSVSEGGASPEAFDEASSPSASQQQTLSVSEAEETPSRRRASRGRRASANSLAGEPFSEESVQQQTDDFQEEAAASEDATAQSL